MAKHTISPVHCSAPPALLVWDSLEAVRYESGRTWYFRGSSKTSSSEMPVTSNRFSCGPEANSLYKAGTGYTSLLLHIEVASFLSSMDWEKVDRPMVAHCGNISEIRDFLKALKEIPDTGQTGCNTSHFRCYKFQFQRTGLCHYLGFSPGVEFCELIPQMLPLTKIVCGPKQAIRERPLT